MAKIWKSKRTSVFSILIGMALAIPEHSKMSPDGLLKSLLVETSGIFPKRVSTRNLDMVLVSIVGLCRASMFVPLNEQGMVVEGERIWIASEERFTSNNNSFNGFTLGKSSSEGSASFWCLRFFRGIAIIPKFDRELRRMNYSFLRCSWFGWGLMSRI